MASHDSILGEQISSLEKGMPPGAPVTVAEIGGRGWNMLAQDVSFPIAVIHQQALLSNAQWMERFARHQNVWLYPHGKTTMAPQLFSLQLQHGCRGITAANTIHAQVYLQCGVESVFIANQVIGRQALARLAMLCGEFPSAEFFLIVDSKENVLELKREIHPFIASGQIKLLLEMGAPGGRTGVRTVDGAVSLAGFMAEQGMPCHGIEAFEGIYNIADREQAEKSVRELLEKICDAYREIAERAYFAEGIRYLSAGGSWFYDLVADYFCQCDEPDRLQTIIRAGCYISHDSGLCKRAYANLLERKIIQPEDHLQPALEVWAQVQSQPEPGMAYANAGKRDLSHDIDLPVVRWWYRPGYHSVPQALDGEVVVTALNDQHAYLNFSDGNMLQVGDLVGFGISHPCTTFDKWKYLYMVDPGYSITGAIKTFF